MNFKIISNEKITACRGDGYNYNFDKKTGFFQRWGNTPEEDPTHSPIGPEIADIEISTVCNGVDGIGPCKFCYKSNTGRGDNMTFETFEKLFAKLKPTVMQIAFGIGDIPKHKYFKKVTK